MALCVAVLVLLHVNRRMALLVTGAVLLGVLWAAIPHAGLGDLLARLSGSLSALTREQKGIIGCVALVLLLFSSAPVAIAMAVVAILLILLPDLALLLPRWIHP
ncbi:MAG: hypothetical protein FJ280_10060 [Planctomycetes bacterium]|nr:hypothetical protein [Planctomycetota bacterium]